MKTLQRRKANKNILPYTVKDLRQLHHSYMPFIQNGGLYVDVKRDYKMGDEFFLLLTLLDEAEQIPLAVKVVWLAGKDVKVAKSYRIKRTWTNVFSNSVLGHQIHPLKTNSCSLLFITIQILTVPNTRVPINLLAQFFNRIRPLDLGSGAALDHN